MNNKKILKQKLAYRTPIFIYYEVSLHSDPPPSQPMPMFPPTSAPPPHCPAPHGVPPPAPSSGMTPHILPTPHSISQQGVPNVVVRMQQQQQARQMPSQYHHQQYMNPHMSVSWKVPWSQCFSNAFVIVCRGFSCIHLFFFFMNISLSEHSRIRTISDGFWYLIRIFRGNTLAVNLSIQSEAIGQGKRVLLEVLQVLLETL